MFLRKTVCAVLALTLLAAGISWQPGSGGPSFSPVAVLAQGGRDLCADPNVVPTTRQLNVTANAVVVTGTTGRRIYVCGVFGFFSGGTAASFKFNQGNGSTCGTSSDDITPALPVTTNQLMVINWGGPERSLWRGRTTNDLCVTVSGAGPSLTGFISFILGQ